MALDDGLLTIMFNSFSWDHNWSRPRGKLFSLFVYIENFHVFIVETLNLISYDCRLSMLFKSCRSGQNWPTHADTCFSYMSIVKSLKVLFVKANLGCVFVFH